MYLTVILQMIIILIQILIIIMLIRYRNVLMERIETPKIEPIEEDNKSKVRDFRTPRGLYTNRPYNKG